MNSPSFVRAIEAAVAALDPEAVKEGLVTIRELAEEGMTCLLVTHEMGFAREGAGQVYFTGVYFTDRGVIVEHGPPEEILTRPHEAHTGISGSGPLETDGRLFMRSHR